jgi:hypothetical protein
MRTQPSRCRREGLGCRLDGKRQDLRGQRLEPKLPIRPGTTNLELRIRSVPVAVASKQGYLT